MSEPQENVSYARQAGIVTPEMQGRFVEIVGAGAVGSWLFLALSKMGFMNLRVTDFDVVSGVNIPGQLFSPKDIGRAKTRGLGKLAQQLGGSGIFVMREAKIQEVGVVDVLESTIISAVDDNEVRRWLVGQRGSGQEFLDFRMGPHEMTVLHVPTLSKEEYLRTLEVEFVEPECGPRALATTAMAGVGAVLNMWMSSLRGERMMPGRWRFDTRMGMGFEEKD